MTFEDRLKGKGMTARSGETGSLGQPLMPIRMEIHGAGCGHTVWM
ncbi:hypothetical protein [Laceyella putida]|uniref:Uncharacterized protein n=1 Tax=Laceyella putida TaxID=110101 RepID=A0ABW2RQP9_9BACL